jgi:hypothetical protein
MAAASMARTIRDTFVHSYGSTIIPNTSPPTTPIPIKLPIFPIDPRHHHLAPMMGVVNAA